MGAINKQRVKVYKYKKKLKKIIIHQSKRLPGKNTFTGNSR